MNKYLVKIEDMLVKEAGDVARGMVLGTGFMEHKIKKDADGKGLTFGQGLKSQILGGLRANGRSLTEGAAGAVAGAVTGAGVAALSRGKLQKNIATAAGGVAGLYSGIAHGAYKSVKNQAEEMHKKYKAK